MGKKEYQKKYMKEYRKKNKEKIKEYNKEYQKEYVLKNKQKKIEYDKKYRKTEKSKKSSRIASWKHWGIIFHDWDLLYEIYLQTTNCDNCNCLLNQCEKSRKCVDHDHSITDDNNVRNILCNCCNVKIK